MINSRFKVQKPSIIDNSYKFVFIDKLKLEEQIQSEIKTAMLAKNEGALRALRAIKAAILIAKTSGGGNELTDDDGIKILQKLVKQRRESIDIYEKQNRSDLANSEKEEVDVIEKYLPVQMSDDEIRTAVKIIIDESDAKSFADLGKVMGVASKQLAGKADNKKVAEIVRQLLTA